MNEVEAVKQLQEKYQALRKEIAEVIVGQDEVVEQLLLAMLCKGHALLVGVPGLAKTLLVNTVSRSLGMQFQRIQFTPDLMPSDIVGSEILGEDRKFRFVPGPVFAICFWPMRSTEHPQDPKCPFGGHAGTLGDRCRKDARHARSFFRFGHAEPH